MISIERQCAARWTSVLVVLGVACATSARPTAERSSGEFIDLSRRSELAGRVVDDEGVPIAGARIAIREAHPLDGTASTCSSCYRECRLVTVSSESGQFTIPSVSAKLRYVLTISAPGFLGSMVRDVACSAVPIEVRIRRENGVSPGRLISIVASNQAGSPIPGAIVEIISSEQDGWLSSDTTMNSAPIAITDDSGRAALEVLPAGSYAVRVSAPGYAPEVRSGLRAGAASTKVELPEGAMLRGVIGPSQSVNTNGKHPSLLLRRRAVERDQLPEIHEADVNARGEFWFSDLSPDTTYLLAARFGSLAAGYYIPSREVRTGVSGSVVTLDGLPVRQARPTQLRIVTTEGSRAAFPCAVVIFDEETGDSESITLSEGEAVPVPITPGRLTRIRVRAPGFELSRTGSVPGLLRYEDGDVLLRPEPGGLVEVRIAPKDSRRFKALPASASSAALPAP